MTKRLALLAAALLFSAAPLHADDAEDAAVKALQKLGGEVTHEDMDPAKPVTVVNLTGLKTTDADLKALTPLKGLKELYIGECKGVTDAGLKNLTALKRLQSLDLRDTQVTDAGMKDLAALKGMKVLILENIVVTDAGLKDLAALKGLQTLDLRDTQVGTRA